MASTSADPDLPPWLAAAKSAVQRSPEWNALANDIFVQLRNEMTAYHVRFFSDLAPKEQLLFLEKARDKLRERPVMISFLDAASDACNKSLREELRRQMRAPGAETTSKVDSLVSTCSQGAEALLRRWPDQKERLRPLINEELGPQLRRSTWRLFLGPSEAGGSEAVNHGRVYERAAAERRLQTVSRFDVLIAQRCQALLASRGEWAHLRGPATVARMKSVLSYLRAARSDDADEGGLAPEYHLMVPLLHVFEEAAPGPAGPDADAAQVGRYVQYLFALIDAPRPRLRPDPRGAEETGENERFAVDFMRLLRDQDPELFDALLRALAEPEGDRRPGGSGRGAVEAVCGLVAGCVERLFVGLVPLPTVLFVWDQLVLGGPWLALHFAALYILLLRDAILPCTSEGEVRRAVEAGGQKLTVEQFRREMERRFMPAVRSRLKLPQKPPLLDPIVDSPARLLDVA